ncbi:hypothetical protein A2801_00125 [Candidatus Woesebacteria bacterium RIFCSPHIGHO2_01_FULL_41_10]|uniref:Uncharacterized protein n=1 Tax=Candidatus Woesebacteria bacterium RIFCSPHIGHO2_01_FULL_41_10 TaxID=1802500 RepID=A0A1F7YTG3_9BACT|nr:MAG: hypothetical protein A2801_00125 [Candidatus Woesebacteria bacterium RIFCSPHIGHO2_01_FULL_41_10]
MLRSKWVLVILFGWGEFCTLILGIWPKTNVLEVVVMTLVLAVAISALLKQRFTDVYDWAVWAVYLTVFLLLAFLPTLYYSDGPAMQTIVNTVAASSFTGIYFGLTGSHQPRGRSS